MRMRPLFALGAAAAVSLATLDAHALPAFYAAGGKGGPLLEHASVVVLMREGTRTVVSIESAYQGPAESFAMVVPVPALLKKEDVRTLSRSLFEHVVALGAPRLYESWEQDPCADREPADGGRGPRGDAGKGARARHAAVAEGDAEAARAARGVRVESAFQVGEYDVAVLTAAESSQLGGWLRANHYALPGGAEEMLAPYVRAGSFFLVAKVNASKLLFSHGPASGPRMATLSPLRFHYDSERFELPIRVGMLSSDGPQDLLVHVLARHQRYAISNVPNFLAPTNIELRSASLGQFSSVYVTIFDRLLESHPGAAVTEYARTATECDATCPVPALSARELLALGADVLSAAPGERERTSFGSGFVLTRMHLRYAKDDAPDDLSIVAAPSISRGRDVGSRRDAQSPTSIGSAMTSESDFATRYLVRHAWEGETACDAPQRGVWSAIPPGQAHAPRARPAMDLAFAPRGGIDLATFVREDVPELALVAAATATPSASPAPSPPSPPVPQTTPDAPASKGCTGCTVQRTSDAAMTPRTAWCSTAGSGGFAEGLAWPFAALLILRARRRSKNER